MTKQDILNLIHKLVALIDQKKREYWRARTVEICKEMGLPDVKVPLLVATIACESGFNQYAQNKNADGTVDYGICQLNSYWYIGATKVVKTPQEALNNPELCIRVMVGQFLNGRPQDWVCYSTGKYIKYL
jgi:hypothetical protein